MDTKLLFRLRLIEDLYKQSIESNFNQIFYDLSDGNDNTLRWANESFIICNKRENNIIKFSYTLY